MPAFARPIALVALVLFAGLAGSRTSVPSRMERTATFARGAGDSVSGFGETPATATAVTAPRIDTIPPRAPIGLSVTRNGWAYNCMECHTLLAGRWRYDRPLNEHQAVALEHGNNRFCLNCHHPTNRNAYVDYDGAEIAQAAVVQLCGKCHGTIFRDWQAGIHGRQNGYWSAAAGGRTNLRCIECHDPHRPAIAPMRPLPPLRYPSRAAYPPSVSTTPAALAGTR